MNSQTLTEGKPYRQIIRFAVPLLLGNLFQQFYNMADAFIISRCLGVSAFAGVSCTSGISNLIIGFAQGMTAGLFASMLFNLFANTLRVLGDSKSPLHYLLLASGINIVLDYLLIQFATNSMGTVAIASYAVAKKIDTIAVEPLRSLGTYTAQNYGAGKYDRILDGVRQCVLISIGMSAALGLIMFFGRRFLASLFIGTGEPEILDLAHTFLIVHGVLYIILALLFDYRYTLQELGDAKNPTIAGLMELAMRTFSAFILVPRMGFFGASIETPLSWLGVLIPVAFVYSIASRKIRGLMAG